MEPIYGQCSALNSLNFQSFKFWWDEGKGKSATRETSAVYD